MILDLTLCSAVGALIMLWENPATDNDHFHLPPSFLPPLQFSRFFRTTSQRLINDDGRGRPQFFTRRHRQKFRRPYVRHLGIASMILQGFRGIPGSLFVDGYLSAAAGT